MSPLLFLLVVECLGHLLLYAKHKGQFQGVVIANFLPNTYLLFVDDILIFCNGSFSAVDKLLEIIDQFGKSTDMVFTDSKSSITAQNLACHKLLNLWNTFPFPFLEIDAGLKYLGFQLKPNYYMKEYWSWLITNIEKRLKGWSLKTLLRAGRLVLVKSILEAILVFLDVCGLKHSWSAKRIQKNLFQIFMGWLSGSFCSLLG